MSDIKCSAVACGFNRNRYCNKRSVKVEGLFSRSKLGTFCQSFKNAGEGTMSLAEMALEMRNDIVEEPIDVSVGCTANYCVFNKNNYCQAKEIKVGNPNAKYRSETECDSFKLK